MCVCVCVCCCCLYRWKCGSRINEVRSSGCSSDLTTVWRHIARMITAACLATSSSSSSRGFPRRPLSRRLATISARKLRWVVNGTSRSHHQTRSTQCRGVRSDAPWQKKLKLQIWITNIIQKLYEYQNHTFYYFNFSQLSVASKVAIVVNFSGTKSTKRCGPGNCVDELSS